MLKVLLMELSQLMVPMFLFMVSVLLLILIALLMLPLHRVERLILLSRVYLEKLD